MLIRAATAADLRFLPEIEVAAGVDFATIGMPEIAADTPPTVEELTPYLDAGLAWVAVEDDRPVAYLVAEPVDDCLHIEQVSVMPRYAHRRIGRALIERADESAGKAPALTLTTFAQVPWNAPYYRRCGFRDLAEAELPPGLRAVRDKEAAAGLDRWPRLAMRRERPVG